MQRRALIVDDEPKMCELMRSVLSSTGLEVLALTVSSQAEAYLRDEKFALALFDLRMPPPDGRQLALLARASGINQMTPIILVSDDQNTRLVSQGFAAGASFFLYKPIDKRQLLRLVRATQGAIEHERRRFRRVAHQSKVRLTFEQQEWEGETVDVSLNGMRVRGPGSIPAGSNVRVSLFLNGEMKPIVGSGSITRLFPGNQMGVHLSQLTMAESGRLQEFLVPLILREEPEMSSVRK